MGSECPQGHYCPKGSAIPIPCAAGSFSFNIGKCRLWPETEVLETNCIVFLSIRN